MKTLAVVAIFLCLPCLSQSKQSGEKPKLARVVSMGSVVVQADGVWQPDNPTEKNKLPEQVTRVTCYRNGGKELVGSESFCLEADASAPYGILSVNTIWMKVIEWSGNRIIATDDSPICLTSQLIFDLDSRTVMALDVRKPKEKGLFGACESMPDRQTYYMQDTADYYVNKRLTRSVDR